jgi:hypothetical protein
MSEILILHPVSRKRASLHLIVPSMGNLKLLPNLTSQVLSKHLIEFGCTKSTKQVIDRLVIGISRCEASLGDAMPKILDPQTTSINRNHKILCTQGTTSSSTQNSQIEGDSQCLRGQDHPQRGTRHSPMTPSKKSREKHTQIDKSSNEQKIPKNSLENDTKITKS